jgi:hypothetical protein
LLPLWSQVRALCLLIWWPLEAYMVVNFRTREISRGTHKLAWTSTLKKIKSYMAIHILLFSCQTYIKYLTWPVNKLKKKQYLIYKHARYFIQPHFHIISEIWFDWVYTKQKQHWILNLRDNTLKLAPFSFLTLIEKGIQVTHQVGPHEI